MPESPIILSSHAVERARERMGLTERQLARLMGKIYQRGATREFMSKELMQWFDKNLSYRHGSMRESVVHAGHMFVVERRTLITIYSVPDGIARLALEAAKLNRETQKETKPS